MSDLGVDLAGVHLESPLVAAAGTCGYVTELADVLDLSTFGAITTKSITRHPREGNAPWRLVDVPLGMINAIGLANMGMERFAAEAMPNAADVDPVVIGSIAGESIEDYVAVAEVFDACEHLPLVELNVSCPNTADGLQFGESPEGLRSLLAAVRPVLSETRMVVKLSPNVTDIVSMAQAAVDGGADVLTLINTVAAMSIDVRTRRPRISRGAGGLSGPAVHHIAVRMIHAVYTGVARDAGIPIIGLGGVMNWEDAAELVLAGASAVGIGTGLFVDPRIPARVHRGLARWVNDQGAQRLADLTGKVEHP